MKKVWRAWGKINKNGKELGKRNCISREPYIQWVKEIVQMIKLCFIFDSPTFWQTPDLVPISVEEVKELRVDIQLLKLENYELQLKLDWTTKENEDLKR